MRTILVVDDDADTCRNMADLLGDCGYNVDTAKGGDIALERAGRQSYDVGLLELRLQGMDGLMLCRRLKHLWPRMVNLIITATCGEGLDEAAHTAGANQVLQKPIDFARLLRLVEQALLPAI